MFLYIIQIEFEFEREDRITPTNPIDIYDNSTKLVYLDINESTMEIKSKVSSPGRYHILVKYYQPNHQRFFVNFKVDTEKSTYHGKLPIKNCPSNSGCREQIITLDGATSFDFEEGVTITITVKTILYYLLSNIFIKLIT